MELMHVKINVTPTREVRILGLDERNAANIFWCAISYRADRLFWTDGYLFCIENYEDAISCEMDEGFFPISQVCYAKFPEYKRYHEVEKGVQIPIVDVSDMQMYKKMVAAIKNKEVGVAHCS